MNKTLLKAMEKTGLLPKYILARTAVRHRVVRRETLVCMFIRGEGLEIGALHNPARTYGLAKVRYADRLSNEELRRQYPELDALPLVGLDYVCDGEKLEGVPDSSQDFVIANHFIEHCRNPILAIKNMLRVLKPGGALLASVPDKRHTFDRRRESTDFGHLMKDYLEGPEGSEEAHFYEWAELVEDVAGADARKERVSELTAAGYSIHYHAWDVNAFMAFLCGVSALDGFDFDVVHFGFAKDEILFVLKAGEEGKSE